MQSGSAPAARSRLVQQESVAHMAYAPQGATLLRFHASQRHVRVIIGPLGSGKTQSVIAEILACMDTQAPDRHGVRRSRWAAVRNTYPDLTTTTITDWRRWTDEMPGSRMVMGSPPTCQIRYRRPDGTTVEAEMLFLAFDLPDDQRKARGLQLTGLWLNETKELGQTNVSQLMSRVGRFPGTVVPGAKYHVVGDTNAPDRDHWLARFALGQCPPDWEFFIQPGAVHRVGGEWRVNEAAENLANLPPDYYRLALQGKAESWVRQNLANEFVFHSDGRPVHPGFNETIHVRRCEPAFGLPLTVGIDFGRTPAAVIAQRGPTGGWRVLAEVTTVNTGARAFGAALRRFLSERFPGSQIDAWGDPAGDQMAQTDDVTPFDMLAAEGLDAWPAPTNDFERRIESLDTLLGQLIDGQPAILIDPSCTMLIRGLAGAYQFKRVQVAGDDRYHDKPVKGPTSHVCEALHYALLGAGEGATAFTQAWKSEELREFDRNGWAPDTRFFE